MKLVLAFALLSTLAIKSALACEQGPPYFMQSIELDRALSSQEYQTEMAKHLKDDRDVAIVSITIENGVDVKLTNGCIVNVVSKYERPEFPGMCPSFVGVKVKSICK